MASEIKVDTVSEKTSGSGVTIDGLLIKDGGISGDVSLIGTTPTFTIGDAGAEDAALVFDGNAQDFYIALDDSADDLLIGLGSTVGTTPAISIDENLQVKIVAATASTSATTGSLIAAGGAGIAADLHVGDDVTLISDSAVLGFGADKDTTLTHTDGTGLTLNSTNKLCFNDTGTYVGSNADGDIDIVSDGTAIDSINIESAGGITLDAGSTTHGITYEDDGTAMLQITNSSSDVIIKPLVDAKDIIFQQYDGTAVLTIEDNATANIPAGKLAIGGTAVTSTAAELNILDGVTSTSSELNLLDGGTSVGGSITVADADGFIINDGGTMKTIPATDISTYVGGGLWAKLGDTSFSGNTASVTFDNVFSSTYRVYKVFIKTASSNSDEQINVRFRSGASGSNADIDDSHYTYKRYYNRIDLDDGANQDDASNGRLASLFEFASQGHMGSNHKPMNIDMTIQDPGDHASNNSGRTAILYNGDFYNNSNHSYNESGSGFYNHGTDPTGITFSMTAGSFGYGNFLLYGLKP